MPQNAAFTAAELAEILAGTWHGEPAAEGSWEISTDSRAKLAGKCFLPLRGERFDGHEFLAQAVAAGAAVLCCETASLAKVPENCPVPVLEVADTMKAYHALARHHRLRFPELKVAAVTGSVGKTTVKEMLRAILIEAAGSEAAVLATAENTNNQFGVPQNLLKLNEGHRFAVIEMGTNHPGEIAPLAHCAMPDAAVVTAIAPCHLEFLGTLYGVAQEKGCVFAELPAEGTAVVPIAAPAVEALIEKAGKHRLLRFGAADSGAEITAEYLSGGLCESTIRLNLAGEVREAKLPLGGRHQALNAAAAAAVALALGVTPDQIAAGLAKTAPVKMRMSEVLLHGVTYVNDAYNANPQSMAAALDHLAGCLRAPELVLVLGDMLELGAFERAEHRKVLEKVKELFPEARLVTVGPRFAREASSLNGCPAILCGSAAGAARVLRGLVHPDDTVFLKGSRMMKLEEAIPGADFIPAPKPVEEAPKPVEEEKPVEPAPVEEEKPAPAVEEPAPVAEEAPAPVVEEKPAVEEEKPAPSAE